MLFCHRQFVFLFLDSSFNKCNLFSYGSGIVLNCPDKCSQVFKIFGIKEIRPDVFCCLHHSRLCTLCWNDYCHHPVKGNWWKTLSPSDELSIGPCPCRAHRFCFWMIYCCVKVAYVLLKLMLVNDREYVLNNLIATGAVFSHLQLWEHQSKTPTPPQWAWQGLLEQGVWVCLCSHWMFLKKCNRIPTISLSRRHNCSFRPPDSVDEGNCFT